jgi:hypothetical protein
VVWAIFMKISNCHFPKKTAVVNGEEKIFQSKMEMEDFLIENWDSIEFPNKSYTLRFWQRILSAIYGDRNWTRSISDNSYNTTANGWYASYSGEETFADCGIRVWGKSAGGDAYYGIDGKICFDFVETSPQMKAARSREIENQIAELETEKSRLLV